MAKGQTFLGEKLPSPGGRLCRHLTIVISDCDSEGNYMAVPVTTFRKEVENLRHEQNCSCILTAGEHSFITHTSWVCLSRSRMLTYREIFNGIQKGLLIRKEDIAPDVLLRIQSGARKSVFLPEKFAHFQDCF
jgi:hypothetical protein